MSQELSFLLTGAGIGLAAGVSPGPLSAFLISQTIKYGTKESWKIVVVPVLTDIPIIFVSLLILSRLANVNFLLGIVSMLGALFVGYLAYDSLTIKKVKISTTNTSKNTLTKALSINFLSPYPYIFFTTVGTPILIKAYKISAVSPILFLVGFFGMLLGTLTILMFITETSRKFLASKTYVYVIKFMGLLLLLFAFLFFKEGLKLVGIIG